MSKTARIRKAFEIYWRLGSDRTIPKLRAAMIERGRAPAERTLHEWSRLDQWQRRIARLEEEARKAEDAVRIAQIREMAERHIKASVFVQQKSMEALIALDPSKATLDGAVRALLDAAKFERLTRGEPTEHREVTSSGATRWDSFSDEQLQDLVRYAHRTMEDDKQATSE
jgi:hypothetical protein